ncbi:MAG: nucleotidyltransferase family protein [Gemmataceae bacterium]
MLGTEVLSGWERVAREVEKVRERLKRSTEALEAAGIPYAVIGGNAVAEWVGRVDPAAVRNTQDVDILIRRADFDAVKVSLERAGFRYRHAASIDMFIDGDGGRARDAVHILFANEKVRPEYVSATPDLTETDSSGAFRTLPLEDLVRMKLTSFRLKDQVHLQDMIETGLVDESWLPRVQPELEPRLKQLLDNPHG